MTIQQPPHHQVAARLTATGWMPTETEIDRYDWGSGEGIHGTLWTRGSQATLVVSYKHGYYGETPPDNAAVSSVHYIGYVPDDVVMTARGMDAIIALAGLNL